MSAIALTSARARAILESLAIPALALAVSLALFGIFVAFAGVNPLDVYALMYKGAFGTWFSWQNTLLRAAPLILAALATALPAHMGMVVIGGEGALVLGGLAGLAAGLATQSLPPFASQLVMALAGMAAGGALIGFAGYLRHYRGVNETISTLLLTYIAIAVFNHIVEGPMRDPASLNKPSTAPLTDAQMIGNLPGMEVHWGLAFGIAFCIVTYLIMYHTTLGFSAKMIGGNVRAARMSGLRVGPIVLIVCALGGAAAGLAGWVEVAAVHGRANASIAVGYGFTGILVAFLARHNPLAIIPVAILLGGIGASGGLLQRHLDLPDASVLVLQGIMFVVILLSESLSGRLQNLFVRRAPA
jgi:ABC-type uncharacterized transport system permease subunit